jgi:CRISPR-associated Csx2 family protein
MSRKVFISFLGTNNYTECVYSHNLTRSPVVKFVQTASTGLCCKDWIDDDSVLIFTTEEALKNWELLKEECKLHIPVKNVMIPSGKNEKEIWEIFQVMYDALQPDDQLYMDITHSFRSIPLLASSLLQYAKFLKNISVKAIYYGAFETLGNPRDILERIPDPKDRIAPVFDLTAFSEIQDWSVAANDFIGFGNTARLNRLINDDIRPVLIETEGKDHIASTLRDLNRNINMLSLNIRTNRGRELIKGKESAEIIKTLGKIKQDLIKPLNPILEDIQKSVKGICKGENKKENMLAVVRWCIDKQLIQEGFTILQEGIISYLIDGDYQNRDKREFTSGFLNCYNCYNNSRKIFDRNRFGLNDDEKDSLEEYLNSLPQLREWSSVYCQITDIRNDINHAGLNKQSLSANDFKRKLEELYERTEKLLPHAD